MNLIPPTAPLAPTSAVAPLLLAAALSAPLTCQSHSVGPYDAESFEAPRLHTGTLPGLGFADGQDGWMLFDSLAGAPNLAATQVQTTTVRSGTQAVRWNAAQMSAGCFGELRRNAFFNLTSGVIESEMDFMITSSAQPSASWGFYTQPAPHPQSAQFRWEIRANGELWYWTTSNRTLLSAGVQVARDVWHHARSVVDIAGDSTALYLDGRLVLRGRPIGVGTNLPVHGFVQIVLDGAGNDSFLLDNLAVRERTARLGLSADLRRLRAGQRTQLGFRLAGDAAVAQHTYALLGSMSGTSPGIPIGSANLPLVPDAFFGLVAGLLGTPATPGFLGQLGPDGCAFASFDTMIPVPASMIGVNLDFAWLTLQPGIATSEPTRVTITP